MSKSNNRGYVKLTKEEKAYRRDMIRQGLPVAPRVRKKLTAEEKASRAELRRLKRENSKPKKHSDYRKLATLDKRAVEGTTKAIRKKARRAGQDIRDIADKSIAVTRAKLAKILAGFESELAGLDNLDDPLEIKTAGQRAIARARVAQAFANLTPVKLRLCELAAVRTPFQIILSDPIIATAIDAKTLTIQQIRTMSSDKARSKYACVVVDEIRSQIPALHADWRAVKRSEIIEAAIDTGKPTGLAIGLEGLRDADKADPQAQAAITQAGGNQAGPQVQVNVQQVTGAALLAERMQATMTRRAVIDQERIGPTTTEAATVHQSDDSNQEVSDTIEAGVDSTETSSSVEDVG